MRKIKEWLLRTGTLVGAGLLVLGWLWMAYNSGEVEAQPTALGPANAILCNQAAGLAAGPSAITQILAAVTGQRINICGWSVTNTAAAGTFSISYGTGSNCGTGTVAMIPALSVGATAVTDHSAGAVLSTPLSQALCITPSVATIAAIVWVSQSP
jgi:hypothetical protein